MPRPPKVIKAEYGRIEISPQRTADHPIFSLYAVVPTDSPVHAGKEIAIEFRDLYSILRFYEEVIRTMRSQLPKIQSSSDTP